MTNVARTTISRKNEFGEYVVRAYDRHGRRLPDADYYACDMADARATAQQMTNHTPRDPLAAYRTAGGAIAEQTAASMNDEQN